MDWDRIERAWLELPGRAWKACRDWTDGLGRRIERRNDRLAATARARAGWLRHRAERAAAELERRAGRPRRPTAPAIVRGLGLAGLGAGVMYYLDPDRGRRRRALVRDQVVHALHELDHAVGRIGRDVRNRSHGLWARATALPRRIKGTPELDDDVLEARVRSRMGRFVSHPRAIEVEAHRGRVVLRGPVLAHEVDVLIAAVASVLGVVDVEDRLEVHEWAGDVAALQGGRLRNGPGAVRGPGGWSPTARLVVGTAGGVLLAAAVRRGGWRGVVLGTLGTGLLARAVTNISVRDWIELEATRTPPGGPVEAALPPVEVDAPWAGNIPPRVPIL